MSEKPTLHTCLSPALLHLYDLRESVVVIIDVLRATSTIAAALHNGARCVIPVATVPRCMEVAASLGAIAAGERDGRVAEGLTHGNSPFEYPRTFIDDKVLVLTTTNGTRLLHMAREKGAAEIVTGSFPNLKMVCNYLLRKEMPVVLACAAWKDRVNMEDTLFAGAVLDSISEYFAVSCDSSHFARNLYRTAAKDLFGFMKANDATHYHRLMNFGLENDIRYCLTPDQSPVLPLFNGDRLIAFRD